LIVPAYNEAQELPGLLESVLVARERYRLGPLAVEVVVGNNGSSDRTGEIAESYGCVVTSIERRSIAAARNGAAREAKGEILAFVDADSRLHPDTFDAIDQTLNPGVVVGATGIRMSRVSLGIRVTMFVVAIVTRIGGIGPGVVFCRRSDWKSVGGFDEGRRYAEDVWFQRALKRLGATRGQRFAWAKGVPAVTSARKYDEFGDWHAFGLVWKWMLGAVAFEKFVQRYWYDSRR